MGVRKEAGHCKGWCSAGDSCLPESAPLVSSSSSWQTRYRTLRNVCARCIAFSGLSFWICGLPAEGVHVMINLPIPARLPALASAGFPSPLGYTAPIFKLSATQSSWERRNRRMHRRQRQLLKLRRRPNRHKKQSAKRRRNRGRPRTILTTTRTLKRSSRMY